jgi:hypothetical protein
MNESQMQHETERERILDSLEEHFWLLEKLTARSHTLVVRLHGVASEEEWREGFIQVQAHHPMLNTSIGKRPGERPFFYQVSNRPLPIDILELTDSNSLESIAEGELLKSFGTGQDPLTRVTVFCGKHQTAIMITSHHAAMDGKAHLQIVQDVLAVISGENLKTSTESLPPSTATRFARTIPKYAGRSPLNDGDPEIQPTHTIPPIRIIRRTVEKKALDSMLQACRLHEVSFHSALLTAMARAGFRGNPRWLRDGIGALTPVNVRASFGLDRTVGMSMVLHRAEFRTGTSFWEDAVDLNRSLKPSELPYIASTFFTLADELVAEEHSPTSHLARIAGTGFVHDLMLTNYGSLDWPDSDRFHIEDLFTAGIAGHPETQKVAAVTRNATLHLTLVSQSPQPHFLETTVEELVAACSE